jgi:hypothetical protein
VPQADSAQAFALTALERVLPTVVRPARYTGNEWNSVVKDWAGRLRVALVYPDVYEEGVCDPLVQTIYATLNGDAEVLCERAFLPWPDMDEAMSAAGVRLYGLESKRPLADFDVVLLVIPDSLSAPAALTALDLAGLPLRRGDGQPPVGAPCVIGWRCTQRTERAQHRLAGSTSRSATWAACRCRPRTTCCRRCLSTRLCRLSKVNENACSSSWSAPAGPAAGSPGVNAIPI